MRGTRWVLGHSFLDVLSVKEGHTVGVGSLVSRCPFRQRGTHGGCWVTRFSMSSLSKRDTRWVLGHSFLGVFSIKEGHTVGVGSLVSRCLLYQRGTHGGCWVTRFSVSSLSKRDTRWVLGHSFLGVFSIKEGHTVGVGSLVSRCLLYQRGTHGGCWVTRFSVSSPSKVTDVKTELVSIDRHTLKPKTGHSSSQKTGQYSSQCSSQKTGQCSSQKTGQCSSQKTGQYSSQKTGQCSSQCPLNFDETPVSEF